MSDEHGFSAPFMVDEFRRYCLLNGLDDIGLTPRHERDRSLRSAPAIVAGLDAAEASGQSPAELCPRTNDAVAIDRSHPSRFA